jgi:hypothetical protein
VIKLVAIAVLALVATASNGMAQSACPSVSVSCVGTNKWCDPPFFFLASVTNTDPTQKVSFEWTVTNGRIVAGQGTSVIKVVGNRDNRSLTASVKLIGAPPECTGTVASISLIDAQGMAPPPKVIEEFGNISLKDTKMRLDSFVYQLLNQPGAMGYIVSDGKWSQAKPAIQYLLTKGINAERLRYVPGNKKKLLVIKLYLVPAGAVPPKS